MKLFRKMLFWLHLIIGCVAGLVIAVLCFTGFVLVFQSRVDHALMPRVVAPSSGVPRLTLEEVMAKLRTNGVGLPFEFVLHSTPGEPLQARWGHTRSVYLNPWTAEPIPDQALANRVHAFFFWNEMMHTRFGGGMRSVVGAFVTRAGTLICMLLALSGIYLWWPRSLKPMALKSILLFKRGLKGKPRDWNWHNVIGFWTLIPMIVFLFTALVWSYSWVQRPFYRLMGAPVSNGRGGGHAEIPDNGSESAAAETRGSASGIGTRADLRGGRNQSRTGDDEVIRGGGSARPGDVKATGTRSEAAVASSGERSPGALSNRSTTELGGGLNDSRDGDVGEIRSGSPDEPRSGRRGEIRGDAAAAGSGKANAQVAPLSVAPTAPRVVIQNAPAPVQPQAQQEAHMTQDQLAAIVIQHVPNYDQIELPIPRTYKQPLETMAYDPQKWYQGGPHGMTQIMIDPATGRVISFTPFKSRDITLKLHALLRSWHTGDEWGILGQFIAAVSCLGALVLVWTGYALTWRRYVNHRKNQKRRKQAAVAMAEKAAEELTSA